MKASRKILLGLLALLLPLSIAAVVIGLPVMERPGQALLIATLAWTVLVTGGILYTFRRRRAIRDYPLAVVLSALYLFLPLLALLLQLNRLTDLEAVSHRMELMERYDRGAGDRVYLFLWDDRRLRRYDVAHAAAAARSRPGDSLDITLVRGLLGLEYLAHVEPSAPVPAGR